ncbi:hypothetical protein MKZ38_006584 [Zalerion maritima]|uniref:Uncharacterized protein n=1 Tax=Zalerion maritima TaxID=339359 RepID=A0AAD5WNP5_9PEZI|nr:hypothetical protein MKZ38_006584 [Zalerion maritima]
MEKKGGAICGALHDDLGRWLEGGQIPILLCPSYLQESALATSATPCWIRLGFHSLRSPEAQSTQQTQNRMLCRINLAAKTPSPDFTTLSRFKGEKTVGGKAVVGGEAPKAKGAAQYKITITDRSISRRASNTDLARFWQMAMPQSLGNPQHEAPFVIYLVLDVDAT